MRDTILEDFVHRELEKVGCGNYRIEVRWNPKLKTTAGRASAEERLIEINPKLAAKAPHAIRQTILHELAHVLARIRVPSVDFAVHGEVWQSACSELGIPHEQEFHYLKL